MKIRTKEERSKAAHRGKVTQLENYIKRVESLPNLSKMYEKELPKWKQQLKHMKRHPYHSYSSNYLYS